MYDGIFRLNIPEEASIVGFADDIAVVVKGRHKEDVQLYANEAIRAIKVWLKSMNLDLATHKTEAVLISSRKKKESVTIQVGGNTIVSSRSIKYLGVMIDDRLNFKTHVEYANKKATLVTNALSRMMPNVGGPRQSRRTLLSSVTNSILLYGAPVWGKKIKNTPMKSMLAVSRRSCLRVCSGYRTISSEAASVIAGILPIDIKAKEMSEVYNKMSTGNDLSTKALQLQERENSMHHWQRRWENSPKGRWTHRLIPNILNWVNRSNGEVNYDLTQFLSGHGGYRSYLYRFGHDNSSRCPQCPEEDETSEHVTFHCPRFQREKNRLEAVLSDTISPTNIVEIMLRSSQNWEAVNRYIKTINNQLRTLERIRKGEISSRPQEVQHHVQQN